MPLENEEGYDYYDDVLLPFFKERMPVVTHGIVHPTQENVTLALEKSDRLEVFQADPDLERKASDYLSHHFAFMHKRFKRRDMKEVYVVLDSASGFPFDEKKGVAVIKYFDYLSCYFAPGNSERTEPIFKDTPKVEYLPLPDILAGKIRIFRNPPLDFLLLEKCYFEDQDDFLQSRPGKTWCYVGFSKENGGWHVMMSKMNQFKYKFKYDVKFWDKAYGPVLDSKVEQERRRWFTSLSSDEIRDLDFLYENSVYAYEILPNGEVLSTGISQKSGRLRTSSNNSIAHIWILFYHYLRVCGKYGIPTSYKHCMSVFGLMAIYSDDACGATDDPRFFAEDELRETYELFGFGIQDYVLSEDITQIDFLGARCGVWDKFFVPVYNRERMLFALLHIAGRISDDERESRVRGLAHNLAFSGEDADLVVDVSKYLKSLGRWKGPLLDVGDLRVAYIPEPESKHRPVRFSGGQYNELRELTVLKHSLSTMKRSSRKSALNEMVASGQLSATGKNWLIEALDPYHDETITLAGYPDNNVGASVIQCVKKTMTFSAPAAVGTGNWDCNIAMFNGEKKSSSVPSINNWQSTLSPSNPQVLSATSKTIQTYPLAGIVAFCAPAGSTTYGSGNVAGTDASNALFCASPTETFLDGNCRVISKGFEVVNTTAPLYRQGAVSVYTQPMPIIDHTYTTCFTTAITEEEQKSSACGECETCSKAKSAGEKESSSDAKVGALPANAGWASTYSFQQPPGTLADAQLLAGTTQWNAEDGVYVVGRMNSIENPAKQLQPVTALCWQDSMGNGSNGLAVDYPRVSTVGGVSTILAPESVQHYSPFDLSGAYFTGLSPQTTLTVNAVWYVERFPTQYEKDLVVLASPSPGFDPDALEVYQRALSKLPVGVKQGENPLGEWFNNVVKAVQDYAVPVGRVVGNFVPGVGAVTSAVDAAATALRPVAKQMKKRERKQAAKKQNRAGAGGQAQNPGKVAGPGLTTLSTKH